MECAVLQGFCHPIICRRLLLGFLLVFEFLLLFLLMLLLLMLGWFLKPEHRSGSTPNFYVNALPSFTLAEDTGTKCTQVRVRCQGVWAKTPQGPWRMDAAQYS